MNLEVFLQKLPGDLLHEKYLVFFIQQIYIQPQLS